MSQQRRTDGFPPHLNLTCTDDPSMDDMNAIESGLKAYNRSVGKVSEIRPLNYVLHDSNGQVSAGLLGRTWGKCCDIRMLWVRNDYRSQGLGGQLLDEAEKEARIRGCQTVNLESFNFQASDFYTHRGYEASYRIDGYADGVVKVFFVKNLATPQD